MRLTIYILRVPLKRRECDWEKGEPGGRQQQEMTTKDGCQAATPRGRKESLLQRGESACVGGNAEK